MKQIELTPIKEKPEYWDEIEAKIIALFRAELYIPLVVELGVKQKVLKNSIDDLVNAIKFGKITFYRGQFSGRFNASTSKELKRLGAQWDRKQRTWKIPQSSLPPDIKIAINAGEARFNQAVSRIDKKLASILPEELADQLKIEHIFDSTLFKVDKDLKKSLKNLTIAPELKSEQRKKIAKGWTDNMKLYIKDFTEKEISTLRKDVQKTVFEGGRYESMIKTIQKSYGVTQNKAKFLARQETSLLMTKFKETRYMDAGVKKYKWGTVAGSAAHPVRPMHKALEGKIFSWDNPPVTDDKGARNNPGQDYNCRCFARPIVDFRK